MLRLIAPSQPATDNPLLSNQVQLLALSPYQSAEPPADVTQQPPRTNTEPDTPAPPAQTFAPSTQPLISNLNISALTTAPLAMEPAQLQLPPVEAEVLNHNPKPISISYQQLKPAQKIPPSYPIKALSRSIEGYVVIEFSIRSDGRVTDTEVIEAKPRRYFERAALQAIKQWKYAASSDEARQQARLTTKITFELEN
ncbi:MAG: TonB family protein [Motiliproteus sp.]|nr:TonB family protein [Motiliproteus sp.]